MSQEPASPRPTEATLETLQKDLASTLLAPESPVANEAAFQRDRQEYSALLEQRSQITKSVELFRSVVEEVGQAESTVQKSEATLQGERNHLLELAAKLGETAFASLQSGEIADDPRFQARKDLQAQINSLRQKKFSLSSEGPSGVVEQASLKAQQLKLIGQIKVEELKVGSVNRALGKEILSTKTEETIRCSSTQQVLDTIAHQRRRISAAKSELTMAEKNLADVKKRAADRLETNTISDAASLESLLKQQQSQLRSINSRVEDLEEATVDKALGYEWLRDNPALSEPLSRLDQLKKESTPRKLAVWPLAVVVIAGHLLANFGSKPLNLSGVGVLLLYVTTGLGGLGLLAYYKPELAAGQRRYKSVFLLFAYSVISIVLVSAFQSLADYALVHWPKAPSWSGGRLGFFMDLPRRLLVTVGQAYQDTNDIMYGLGEPESFPTFFKNHMLSVGLVEEIIKLSPALFAFAAFTGPWQSRSKEFNSKIVYLAMIGGLAFGLGEAVYYHFTMYAPMQFGWGVYATRFLSLVTIHSVWAGISGWILAYVTGGWIRKAFTTVAHGFGPIGGCLLVVATVGVSDVLHTSHNLSNNQVWTLTWDVVSLALFAWLIGCSSVSQLIPEEVKRRWKRGISTTDVTAAASRLHQLATGNPTPPTELQNAAESSIDTQSTDLNSRQPQLWNPNAAGFWSLLLSPIFGAWLHAKNWSQLGQPDKAKQSMLWVYASVAVVVMAALFGDVNPSLFQVACGGLLVVWWIKSGNEQYKYVSEHCPDYDKKSWSTPLSLAGFVAFGLVAVSLAFTIDTESQQAMGRLAGTWSVRTQHSEVDQDSGVETRVEFDGTYTYSLDGDSQSQGQLIMTYAAPRRARQRLTFNMETQGTWTFDGTILREFSKSNSIEPGDAATLAIAKNDPDSFSNMRKQMALMDNRGVGSVTFVNENEVELIDNDTGWIVKMRRITQE